MGETQKKGDLGVSIAIGDLKKQGIDSSIPISESLSYDLVGDYKGTLKRIQVRYSKISKSKKGIIETKLKSVWSNSKGYQVRKREVSDFEILCIYCPDTDKCYYLKAEDFNNSTAIALRVVASKINIKTIRYADDYRDCIRCFGSV